MKHGWIAVMTLMIGCGSKDKAPKADVTSEAKTGSGAGAGSGSGSGSGSAEVAAAPTADSVAVPPLPGDGERAFVADKAGLVEVSASGESKVVVPGQVTWCEADARGKVVWFKTERGLSAFDLEDRRVRSIIESALDDIEVIIN